MNRFAPAPYSETVQALALGVEPIDAAREQPMLMPVMLTHDDQPLGNRRQPFQRHPSNRQVLLYDAYHAAQARNVDLRLFDQAGPPYRTEHDRRRFVPRRLRIGLPSLAGAEAAPPAARGCRPHLFPGSAYPLSDCVTGLRAHVMRAATALLPLRPARWARVVAGVPAAQADLALASVVGRAMCDERGEFLLLIRHEPAAIGFASALALRVHVFAAPEAAPPNPQQAALDPLWDLPLEAPASLADNDPVLRGEALPAGYGAVASRVFDLPLGRLQRGQPPLVI